MASGLEAYQAAKKLRSERDQRLAELEGNMKEKNIFDELLGIEKEKSKVLDLDEAATANEQRLQDHINNPASPINSPEDLLTKWQSLKAMRPEDYKQEMLQRNKQLTGELPDEQRKLDQERLTGQRELERSIIAKNRPQSDIEGVDFQLNSGLDSILNKLRQPQASISASGVPALTPDQLASGQLPSINSPEVSRSPDSVTQKMSGQQKGGTKPPPTGTSGGNKGGTPELDPLAQYKELLKLQEERQAKGDAELADAQKQRDINAALGMITSGLSKAGAAYGGGSVTQLKGDTSAEEMLNKTADQKIADIREKMKNATETEKNVLQKQLTLAQMQKMRDDKLFDEKKLGLEYAKLAAEKAKTKAGGVGFEAMDKDFGKQYAEYITKDKPRFENASKVMNEVISELKSGKGGTTGPIVGRLGKWTGDVMSTESAALEQKAQSAVLDMLKSTFPGAISDDERKVFFANAYDRALKPEQNVQKLERLRQDIINKNEQYVKAGEYFKQTGTLKGFDEQSAASSPMTKQSQPTSKKDWMK